MIYCVCVCVCNTGNQIYLLQKIEYASYHWGITSFHSSFTQLNKGLMSWNKTVDNIYVYQHYYNTYWEAGLWHKPQEPWVLNQPKNFQR